MLTVISLNVYRPTIAGKNYYVSGKIQAFSKFDNLGYKVNLYCSSYTAGPFGGQRANPYQLDIFESYVYWTTSRPGTNYVVKMGKNVTAVPPDPIFNTDINKLGGIKVYHDRRYWTDSKCYSDMQLFRKYHDFKKLC